MDFFRGVLFVILLQAAVVGVVWGAMWLGYHVIAPSVFGPIPGRH